MMWLWHRFAIGAPEAPVHICVSPVCTQAILQHDTGILNTATFPEDVQNMCARIRARVDSTDSCLYTEDVECSGFGSNDTWLHLLTMYPLCTLFAYSFQASSLHLNFSIGLLL